MKSLIIKDFLNVKGQLKVYGLLLIFYSVFSFATKATDVIGAMFIMLSVLIVINTLSYDDKVKWDKYSLTMPISRSNIVLGKYTFGLILLTIAFLLSLGISTFTSLAINSTNSTNLVIANLAMLAIGIIFMSLILPILFKFGVEKGRMLMMLVLLIPVCIAMIFQMLDIEFPQNTDLDYLIYVIPVVLIVILVLSIVLSVKIYNKKEF